VHTATELSTTATAHCRCCTAWTTVTTTPASTTSASSRSGCRRPTVASPIPITSREANRHGVVSQIEISAKRVALVAWWPSSYLHQRGRQAASCKAARAKIITGRVYRD
jgi:hypothetical protein